MANSLVDFSETVTGGHYKCRVLESACKDDEELRAVLGDSIGDPELMRKKVNVFSFIYVSWISLLCIFFSVDQGLDMRRYFYALFLSIAKKDMFVYCLYRLRKELGRREKICRNRRLVLCFLSKLTSESKKLFFPVLFIASLNNRLHSTN